MSVATKIKRRIGRVLRGPAPVSKMPSSSPAIATLSDGKFSYNFAYRSEKERSRADSMFSKEKGTIAWLDRELGADDVFFDVGANIGVFTIFGALRIGARGAVVAFEPHIPNAARLIENILINSQQNKVKLCTMALTNSERFDNFNYHSTRTTSSTSQFGGDSYEGETFEPEFVEVKSGCTLDTLCDNGLIPMPDIVKIDVDGLDFEVLQGMAGLLKSPKGPRSIQIELGSDSKPKIMQMCAETGYLLKEKHWTSAGLDFIAKGNNPEDYPHYGIFYHPNRI
jgi:FkbM family methyltransferase